MINDSFYLYTIIDFKAKTIIFIIKHLINKIKNLGMNKYLIKSFNKNASKMLH